MVKATIAEVLEFTSYRWDFLPDGTDDDGNSNWYIDDYEIDYESFYSEHDKSKLCETSKLGSVYYQGKNKELFDVSYSFTNVFQKWRKLSNTTIVCITVPNALLELVNKFIADNNLQKV